MTARGDDPGPFGFPCPESGGSGKKMAWKFWKCFSFCYSEKGESLVGDSSAFFPESPLCRRSFPWWTRQGQGKAAPSPPAGLRVGFSFLSECSTYEKDGTTDRGEVRASPGSRFLFPLSRFPVKGAMKRPGLQFFFLVLVTAIALAILFYLPYTSVQEKTINSYNQGQMMLANQAIKGIRLFFDTYDKALHYFSTQPSIIDLDDSGRLLMQDFYTIHSLEIAAITRVDAEGRIMYTVPEIEGLVGRDVSSQHHNRALIEDHTPMVSDVFTSVQGFESIAFSYPVFRGTRYVGAITFLFPFAQLAEKYLETIDVGDNGMTLLLSRQGVCLYCSDRSHVGRNVEEVFADSPGLLSLSRRMLSRDRGSFAFTVAPGGDGGEGKVTEYAVFAPVDLPGNTFWSIAVASPEDVVLATMADFRDQWILVTSVVLAIVLLLSFFLTRALAASAQERQRKRVEDQLRRLLEYLPAGIVVWDRDATMIYINHAVLELLDETDPEKILGRKTFDFIHPDFREEVRQRYRTLLEGGHVTPDVVKLQTATGREKIVELDSVPFTFNREACFISLLVDVEERYKAEETRRRLVTAIEQARESIVITDSRGVIEYVNPAFTDVTGFGRDEVIGLTPRILRSGEHDTDFYRTIWETITAGRVWQGRIVNRRKDGTLFTESATISPVRNTIGKITHYVAVKRDITHEVELEAQLRQAQKMEAIGTLAGGIAHDFNNILGAILGFTDMALLHCDPGSPLHENLTHIRKGGKRAADLVQQILTFSRMTTAEKEPVPVVPLVRESLKLLRASLPATIEIEKELDAAGMNVLANPVKIQQVVMNLCTNAFHAMRDRGGLLTVTLDTVPAAECRRMLTSVRGDCVRLTVSDTGTGIDPETMERIFDPFFTTKGPGEGTGLGLSVVHGIVRDLGGTITVSSEPGEGTTFTVILPAVKKDLSPVLANLNEPLPGGTEHILIVDDETDILETCKMMLQHLGYAVTLSSRPLAAVELVREQNELYDLVITDQTMPKMTGSELIGELLAIRPGLPIILCTGYSDKVNEEVARRAGARRLLMKPVELRKLARAIREVLDDNMGGPAGPASAQGT